LIASSPTLPWLFLIFFIFSLTTFPFLNRDTYQQHQPWPQLHHTPATLAATSASKKISNKRWLWIFQHALNLGKTVIFCKVVFNFFFKHD
jgi:hypothetical protein